MSAEGAGQRSSCSISLASALPPHEIGWCESFQRNESTVRVDKNPTVIPRPNTAPVGSPGRQHLAWLIGEQTTFYGIQTGLYLRAKLKLSIQILIIIWKWWPTQHSGTNKVSWLKSRSLALDCMKMCLHFFIFQTRLQNSWARWAARIKWLNFHKAPRTKTWPATSIMQRCALMIDCFLLTSGF